MKEQQNQRSQESTANRQVSRSLPANTYIRRPLGACFAVLISILFLAQTVIAAGEGHDTTGHGLNLHVFLEVVQLLIGTFAVGTAIAGTQTMRGGHMERAFYSLTAGVLVFLLQRLWHSGHEFGLLVALPNIAAQFLFLLATGLIGLGFYQIYRIMR